MTRCPRTGVTWYRRGAEGNGCGGSGDMRRGTERDPLVDVTPYEPTQAGHQQQQYRDSGPAKPQVGAIAPSAFTARLAGILGKTHPAVFIADCGGLMRREVTSDPFFLVEAHNPGILAHHTAVKYPSRKDVEVLLFEGHQVTVADFSDPGNGVQGNPAKLPLLLLAPIPASLELLDTLPAPAGSRNLL
jgi:hypothetical protein